MAKVHRVQHASAVERTGIAPGDTAPTTTHEAIEFDAVAFVRLSFPSARSVVIASVTPAYVTAIVDEMGRMKLLRKASA